MYISLDVYETVKVQKHMRKFSEKLLISVCCVFIRFWPYGIADSVRSQLDRQIYLKGGPGEYSSP